MSVDASRGPGRCPVPAAEPLPRATAAGIGLLLVLFLLLGGVYSVVTPLFEAPDEIYHYAFARHLAGGKGLPVLEPSHPGPWHQEGGQPPLYYALATLAGGWVPGDDLTRTLLRNPRADVGLAQANRNVNLIVHTAAEAMPYRGAVLGAHLMRGLSVVLGALTVLFTCLVGLEVLPHRPALALAAAALVAFNPMFLFLSGSVNNDNLAITLATIALWQILRLLRLPPHPARFALLGATIGLAALSKLSGLALLPLAALALAWLAWRRHDAPLLLWGGTCIAGTALLVAGWWYLRNWQLYGDPTALNVFVAIVKPRRVRPTLAQQWRAFAMSYWGVFGWMNVVAPRWFYRLLDGLALLAGGGLLVGAARRPSAQRRPDAESAFRLGLLVAWSLIILASVVRYSLLIRDTAGRLVFPAIPCLSYLLVLGLWSWADVGRSAMRIAYCALRIACPAPRRMGAAVGAVLCGARNTQYAVGHSQYTPALLAATLMAGLATWVPFGVIGPAYARPPLLTPAQEAAIADRLDLVFDGRMDLLGYRLGAKDVRPGQSLPVTLYWRAPKRLAGDLAVFVHLVDEAGRRVGQRDTYLGGSAFPATLWQRGDVVAETYRITVAPDAADPSLLHVEAGLCLPENGSRLAIRRRDGGQAGDQVRFGQIIASSRSRRGVVHPVDYSLGSKVALVHYALDRTSLVPGDTLCLTLGWRALESLDRDYTVFVHLLGPDGAIVAQEDTWPQDGVAPTSRWPEGKIVEDSYLLPISPEAPEGVYQVEVGMYLQDTLECLPVLAPDGQLLDGRVLLDQVRIQKP